MADESLATPCKSQSLGEEPGPNNPCKSGDGGQTQARATLTDGDLGVSLPAIRRAGLCPSCKSRFLRIIGADIQALRLRRAHLLGELSVIDTLILGDADAG